LMDLIRRSSPMVRLVPVKPFLWRAISINKMIKVFRRHKLKRVKMKV